MATEAAGAGAPLGITITGELVEQGPGRAYGEGERRRTPYEAALLIGRDVAVVRFDSREDAEPVLNGHQRGDVLTLRVFPRVAGARNARAACWVEYGAERGNGAHTEGA